MSAHEDSLPASASSGLSPDDASAAPDASAEDEATGGPESLPPRTIRGAVPFPSAAQRTRLQSALQELGYCADAAAALSRAVEDPRQVIDQLRAPVTLGVHGGTLTYIVTRVRNGAVLPIPTNPRVSGRIRYPAGGYGGGGIEPLEVDGDPGGAAALTIRAHAPGALRADMRTVLDEVTSTNDLGPSVQQQGVLLPVTVVPVAFEFRDGSPTKHAACTVDGSSRTTAALRTWGLTPEDVLFDLTTPVALQARTREITALLGTDADELTESNKAALRNQTIPANIVVGWAPEDDSLSFADLIDAYLGLIHVEPPTPWSEAASQDSRADAVLDELERSGRISALDKRYLAGLMAPEEATSNGFDASLDGRAAAIFYTLDRRWNANAVNRGLRRIGMKHVDRTDRLEVATELAMRPYRAYVVEMARRNPRQALPQALLRLRPDNAPWEPSFDTPEELLQKSLEEGATIGPSTRELAVRAAFWLTRFSSLQKSSRTDTRFADELLEDVSATMRGRHQLYQAILDGRTGEIPRQVREDGTLARAVTGETLVADDRWLRTTFPAQLGETDDEPEEEFTPADDLRLRTYAIRDDVATLASKIDALADVKDGDHPLVDIVGIPDDIAADIGEHLSQSRDRVQRLGFIWQMSGGATRA